MFEPFTNYVWNLSTSIALNTGGQIGEVDAVCRALTDADRDGDAGTERFFDQWCALADRLVDVADEDVKRGRELSAGARYQRAAVYYLTAERMQSRTFPLRRVAYRKMLDAFERGVRYARADCTAVEVPYEGTALDALFVPAAVPGRAPCMVFCQGLDSAKEMVYGSGIAQELSRRGVSTLIVDQPGTGQSLRLRGLTGYAESERWASACVDYLQGRPDVDPNRLGIMGWSLGGYYAPRAAAFEPRFAICVAWGANYDWGELQRKRLANEGDRPVPHYWEHVQWVFGKETVDDFMAFAPQMSLVGVVERITVPFLVTHGSGDRQIPGVYAERQYDAAVNSPKRELVWFTEREGGVEHVSADNMSVSANLIADWIAETL